MKPYEKTSEDPAIPVILALNRPPVQLSAVNNFMFFLAQSCNSFFDNLLYFNIYRTKINVNKSAEKTPAKISSKITPKVLFILSNRYIG